MAHRFGAPLTVALGGLGCIAGAAVFAWLYPAASPSEARPIRL